MQKQNISTMYTVQGMRKFVCDRLTEAAQDILGAFEKRAQEYETELARQRRQLESVFSPELKQRTDLGPQIKEEQHEINISEILQPNASTSVQRVHSEFQNSEPVVVQSTIGRKPQEHVSTSHQEADEPSSHPPESTNTDDQTITINGNATPTKHAHSHKKYSHGFRLSKGCELKQLNTNRKHQPPLMEIIEICDSSPTFDDLEIIQFDNESGSKQNHPNKKSNHENVTVESEEPLSSKAHKQKSKSSQNNNPQCSHTLTQDANQHNKDDNINNGKSSTCSKVPSDCSEPTQSGQYILSEDDSEQSTGVKSDDKSLQGISENAKTSNNGHLKPVECVEQSPNKSGKKKSPRQSPTQDANPDEDDDNNMGNALSTFIDMSSSCSNIPSELCEPTAYERCIGLLEAEVTQTVEPLCKNSTGAITNENSLHGKTGEAKLAKEFNSITFPGSESSASENYNADNGSEPAHNVVLRISEERTGQTEMNMDSIENTASTSRKRQNDEDAESYVSNEQRKSKRIQTQETTASEMYSHEYNTPSQNISTAGQKSQSSKNNSNPLECDRCGKKLSNFKNYKSHMKTHTVEKSFKCETCGKMFREGWHLNKHVLIHNVQKFKCTICEREFNRCSNLDLHMRIHTGEKPYACGSCEKAFASRVNLKKHERTHTGEKPYTCDHCKKEFADCSSFRNHQRIHTGEKPWKRFATRTTLKRHLRIHTGEKPYKCSVCEKSFATNTDMKVHFRIHTGERPYKCNNCGQTFSCWTNWNRHQNVHKQKDQ